VWVRAPPGEETECRPADQQNPDHAETVALTSGGAWGAALALAGLCTALAYILYFRLLASAGGSEGTAAISRSLPGAECSSRQAVAVR